MFCVDTKNSAVEFTVGLDIPYFDAHTVTLPTTRKDVNPKAYCKRGGSVIHCNFSSRACTSMKKHSKANVVTQSSQPLHVENNIAPKRFMTVMEQAGYSLEYPLYITRMFRM